MTDDMKYIYLRSHPLMSSLTEQKLKEIATMAKMRTACRGKVISYGDDGHTRVHFLVKVRRSISCLDRFVGNPPRGSLTLRLQPHDRSNIPQTCSAAVAIPLTSA